MNNRHEESNRIIEMDLIKNLRELKVAFSMSVDMDGSTIITVADKIIYIS